MELISIIIPCYNHGKFLEECLNSIRNQTYLHWEIIIVNDGSTDPETINKLSKISHPRIKILNQSNAGLAAARNLGIISAVGKYILPLDADDKVGNSYLELAVNKLEEEPDIGMVFCQGAYFGVQTGNMNKKYSSFKSELLYNAMFCSGIFRRNEGIEVGLYNTNMNLGYEDWDFWLRLLSLKPKVYQISETLFFYRKTGVSMWDGLSGNIESRTKMENTLFKNNMELYLNEWGSMIGLLREYESMKMHQIDIDTAKKEILNSVSYKIGNFFLAPLKLLKRASKNLKIK